ncbi:hypothetical protein DVH24_013516 [Malus domestica]|uniref:BHLH domain-containing protein n=1 Tax=Malus domestica TaxID=3750 RepID=A0A498HJ89_MALDO|nr:hypothetical protein DVH24_013516 [Malus domestica]
MEEWIDYLDYIDEPQPTDFLWPNGTPFGDFEFSALDVPSAAVSSASQSQEKECPRKRFVELNGVLEPGRPPKTDKAAMLDDTIKVLNQMRAEAQELTETNQKLLEEVKSLKVRYTSFT